MMSALRWRALLVALLMLASAAAAVVGRPTMHMADQVGMPNLETMFPKSFGTWRLDTSMPVILPSPDVQALLDKIYNQVLSRTYINAEGQRIMLSVAYGGDQSDGTSAHRPEVCYPAQGFAITVNRSATLNVSGQAVPARLLVSKLGARVEPITYWVVVGDRVVTSGLGQKLTQMRYGLRGIIADGMLVRVSSIDGDESRAHQIQARFVGDMAREVAPNLHSRVFGHAAAP